MNLETFKLELVKKLRAEGKSISEIELELARVDSEVEAREETERALLVNRDFQGLLNALNPTKRRTDNG